MDALLEKAYKTTLDAVDQIRQLGIQVIITPCNLGSNPEFLAKYDGPFRLAPDKWIHITFHVINEQQADLVHAMSHVLCHAGIFFDSGGCRGQRDWDVDWSFHLEPIVDAERHSALTWVEKAIRKEIGAVKVLH